MKLTRFKSKLSLGIVFAVFGLLMFSGSVWSAWAQSKPHGWDNIIEEGLVGFGLLVVGIGLCCDKDTA